MDVAASIQAVTEEVVLRIGRHVRQETGLRNLVLAGGVALNCVANGRLLRDGEFDDIWIQPAAGDAGGALGAALFVWHQLLENPRRPNGRDAQHGSFLGPSYTTEQVVRFLAGKGTTGQRFADPEDLLRSRRRLAGRRQGGRLVPGADGIRPESPGRRSIIGDPRSPTMQATMNVKIKFRESFRPFAPGVLRERAGEWFEIDPEQESPYMLLVAPVLGNRRVPIDAESMRTLENDPDLRRRVNVVRSEIPAVTHVDYSARLQTVDHERNPRFHGLLEAFDALTGCPVLVNTSFNVRGEPIVCTPEDAYRCFLATNMDALVLEDVVVVKDAASRQAGLEAREAHLAQFQLD